VDNETIRIMSFAGGSTKGYGANLVVKKILQQLSTTASQFFQNVDAMAGTSIGSILACGYAYGKTPDELTPFFLEKAKYIFSTNSIFPSTKVSTLYKANWMISVLGGATAWYDSGEFTSWGHAVLHQTLIDNFGDDLLLNLNVPVVVPAVQHDTGKAILFSNYYDPPYFVGAGEKIVDVCRASSAATPYLPEYTFGGHDYIDGAFMVNNAVQAAINIGRSRKPNAKRIVVIDIGCGIKGNGFEADGTNTASPSEAGFYVIVEHLERTFANVEDYGRWMLQYSYNRHNDLNGIELHYYKFQPKFPLTFSNDADESEASWFAELEAIVEAHYAAESANISSILSRWMA